MPDRRECLIAFLLVACGAGGGQTVPCSAEALNAELDAIDTSQVADGIKAVRLEKFGLVPYECGLRHGQEAFRLIAARARYRAAIHHVRGGEVTYARKDVRAAMAFAARVATTAPDDRVRSEARTMFADLKGELARWADLKPVDHWMVTQ